MEINFKEPAMGEKKVWENIGKWFRDRKSAKAEGYQPAIDSQGLITPEDEIIEDPPEQQDEQTKHVLVKKVQGGDKNMPIEKLQAGFDNLVTQLEGINNHLNRQAVQTEDLMKRIDKLPEMLEAFPAIMEIQKQSAGELIEQLKIKTTKDQQFIETIEKIPNETAKQTDALVNITNQLSASADTDVQMVEGLNKFNGSLEKLNQSTIGQTDSIAQMGKTFAASDRYLKYLMSRQNRRFMWAFFTALGVCIFVILALIAIVIYIQQ